MTKSTAWALSTLVVLAMTAGLGAQGTVIAIRGVTLIDGTGRAPVAGATVVIEGSRIRDVGTHASGAGRRHDHRRHREVPDSRPDRRAHPPARRARRQPAGGRPGARGHPRAARLSLLRRDDGVRCRQPARVHHGAARQGAERRDRQPADLRHRRHRRQPERTRRSLQRRGVAGRSQAARRAPRHQAGSREDRPGRARLGHASADQPAARRICSRRSSATTTARACASSSTCRTSTTRSKRSTRAPTRWRIRSSRRR